MADFTLDTSGYVVLRGTLAPDPHNIGPAHQWTDLTPFQQGYGAAMARALYEALIAQGWTHADAERAAAFANWSPEALAMILRDCEAFASQLQADYTEDQMRTLGHDFWRCRNDTVSMTGFPSFGGWAQLTRRAREFPPLTITLADDGKVHLAVSHG